MTGKPDKPTGYELRSNPDGTYQLIIWGAIRFDGLSFAEAVSKIYKSETGEYPGDN